MITKEKIREYINLNKEMLLEIFKLSSALYEIDPERYPYLDAALYTSRLFDIPVKWLWMPIDKVKKEVSDELKEYLKIKRKAEIEDYESAIKDFKNRIKYAKKELEKLEDEEKEV